MKKSTGIAAGIALAALISQPLVVSAASPIADDAAWVTSAFGSAVSIPSGAEMLSSTEMEEATGRFAPLFLTFAIAGFDVALMGLYWGVYVPNYSGGACVGGCSSSMINQH